jgi:hypothetical protein
VAKADLERLIGKAMLDPTFRKRLLDDPETVVQKEGFDLTEKEIASIKAADGEKAQALAEQMMEVTAAPWAS